MSGSLRLSGNGGLCSLIGLFRNSLPGRYRSFATSPENSVVFDPGRRKVVITPAALEEFLTGV